MLNICSIGLSKDNISDTIKDIVKKADLVYLENYTSVYDASPEELEKIFGKKIIVANRELVENSNEILENAKIKNVTFLVIGDVFAATTHAALFLEAKKQNIPVKIIHNASIFTAIGETGLSLYKFGKTISIPFNYQQTEELLKILENNLKNNMKKGQISMNMIVYIAIALLVLVLIVAFVTGGFGQMFGGLSRSAPQDLETIQAVCTNDCNKAKALVETGGTSAWASSRYCTITHGYDLNNDGDVTIDEYLNCWEPPISIDCTKTVRTYDAKGTETTKTCKVVNDECVCE